MMGKSEAEMWPAVALIHRLFVPGKKVALEEGRWRQG
jgi:hypothetical protein